MINKIIFAILIFLAASNISSQYKEFQLIFSSYPPLINWDKDWLETIQKDCGATGIILYVPWKDHENDKQPGQYYFADLDTAIRKILDRKMKVFIRAAFNFKPAWASSPEGGVFKTDDYQCLYDGSVHSNPSDDRIYNTMHPLNFVSDTSRKYMLEFYTNLLAYLQKNFPGNIDYVFPSTSTNVEMEYQPDQMCGYSSYELIAFRNFLASKYNFNVALLNNNWQSDFTDFVQIDPKKYNWHKLAGVNIKYSYHCGRVDWMEFRTKTLKNFIDTCSEITHSYGFKMGIELGSIYDWAIENRGWYDPASLAENVDFFKIADIAEYVPNRLFGADYMRSICRFWMTKYPGRNIAFSNETNWAGWNNHSAKDLIRDWNLQLEAFYNKGAETHFVMGWDWHKGEDLNNLIRIYDEWFSILKKYKNKPVKKTFSYDEAVHLSCEYGNYSGNPVVENSSGDVSYYNTFLFLNTIRISDPSNNKVYGYNGESEIVTNHMIEKFPEYINRFNKFYLTLSSVCIPDKTYEIITGSNINVNLLTFEKMLSAEDFNSGKITGVFNEYNKQRNSSIILKK